MNTSLAIVHARYGMNPSRRLKRSYLENEWGSQRGCLAFFLAMLFLLPVALCAIQPAVGQTNVAYNSARSFLDSRENATSILEFVHFRADYRGHRFLRATQVVDEQGNLISGEFALVYRYFWADDGWTDLAFFCDSFGQVLSARAIATNAVISQPFALANLSIEIVSRIVVNSDDKMSDSDRRKAIELIDQADANGLLNLWLRLQ